MKSAKNNLAPLHRTLIKAAIDLGPLLIFFAVNALAGIFAATGAFMVAFFIALGAGYALERKLSPMTLITGGVVLIFGGLTLYLNDETFIKLKPTLVNAIFAAILFGGHLTNRPLIRYLFEHAFQLDDDGWRILTLRWALFFAALAVLNEIVWRNFSTDTWAAFKVFGIFPLTLIFGAFQLKVIERHHVTSAAPEPGNGQKSPLSPGGFENGANTEAERTDA